MFNELIMNHFLPNLYRKLLLVVGFAVLSLPAFGQQTEKSVSLDSVVIASSRTNITKAQADHQITIITEEQIQAYPTNSIDELLRYVSGMEVLSRSTFGAQADISIRGGTFNQVLVMVDGVRINDPLTGHFNNYLPIAIAEIHRIEIVKGSSSGIYGSDAVGGIIHIISKTFAKTYDNESTQGELEGWYGENNLIRINGGGIVERKKWAIGGGFTTSQSDGHLTEGDSDSIRSEFNLSTYSLSGAYTPNDKLSVNLRTAIDVRDFNARYFYTRSTLDQSVEEVSRRFTMGSIKYQHSDDQQTVFNFGNQRTTDLFLFNPNPVFPANDHTTRHNDLNLYHLTKVGDNTKLTIGTHYLARKIVSTDRGDHETRNFGLYWLLNQQVGKTLNINGGIRLDHDPAFNWQASPQIGFNWRPVPQFGMRGFAGKSIRSADFTERYVSNNLAAPLTAGRNLGNPDLNAEKAWNYEFGTDLEFIPGLTLSATLFFRNGTDIIDFVLTPGYEITNAENASDSSEYFYARNFSRLNTSGAEITLNFNRKFGKSLLEVNGGLMVLSFSNPDGAVSKYIANNAGLLANFGARFHHKYFAVSVNGIYKDRDSEEATAINRSLKKSYFVLNGRADIHPFKFPLTFSAIVSNILDEQYADILGANLPGRWIQGGISYRFRK